MGCNGRKKIKWFKSEGVICSEWQNELRAEQPRGEGENGVTVRE